MLGESTSSILEIALGMSQKSGAANIEILIFRGFPANQSPKMAVFDQNLDFDPLKNCEKSKFQKSPHNFFVSSPKLSPDQISALLDL